MIRAKRQLWAIVLGIATAGTVAPAAERQHTVAGGESASAIAKRYYGDFELAGLLMQLNGRSGTVIHPGEKLRVPYCVVHTVRSGDSWSKLAQRYLGRPSAWPEIAELNGLQRRAPLQPGQRIVMPVVLAHSLERGESLATLAERFYGDLGRARMLQSWNRIEDPRTLSVGRSIEIPLVTLQLAEPPAPPAASAEAAAEEARRRETSARFLGTVRAARRAYDAGDYDRARELLESQRSAAVEKADAPERAEYWQLLAFVRVAFDRQEEACAAWASLHDLTPSVELDPDLVSPKIRESTAACPPR